MSRSDPVLILGAGPAGIGAGLALGEQAMVLESNPELGGLCQTIQFEGALFDLGGHSFHTPHPEIRQLVFEALEMVQQRRYACCFFEDTMLPYPFQTHFHQLPDAEVVRECALGLLAAGKERMPRNFEEYLLSRFGEGIAQYFLLPYNRKLWGDDLRRLAVDWTTERVPDSQVARACMLQSSGQRTPLQRDTHVAYPAQGGFGEIMRALARRLPDLRLGQTVVQIDPRRRALVTSKGDRQPWRQVVSTLSLHRVLRLLPNVPKDLADAVTRLEAVSLKLILVVIDHPVNTPIQRVYCAGGEIPAHKIVLNHNSSPALRALPRHGILAEVAGGADVPDDELVPQVVQGLVRLRLLRSPDEVYAVRVIPVPVAYPIPTLDRLGIVADAKAWLERQGIQTIGRFGEWAYINADEALYRGLQVGRQLRLAMGPSTRVDTFSQRIAA